MKQSKTITSANWRIPPVGEAFLSFALMILVALIFDHPWDGFVFQRTVEDLLLRGVTPYELMENPPLYTYHGWTLPLVTQWYAYPPLPLLLFVLSSGGAVLAGAPDIIVRILVKMPAILGTLALAFVVRHMVGAGPNPDRANLGFRAILWNPLFLIVAAVWGQFESLMVVFLLLATIGIGNQTWKRAGFWFVLALLCKPYVIFLAPLFAVAAWKKSGIRGAASAAAVAFGTGLAVCLPFLIMSPNGFLTQVAGMHAARPPDRFAPLAAIYGLLRTFLAGYGYGVSTSIQLVSSMSVVLSGWIVMISLRRFVRSNQSGSELLRAASLSMLGAILVTKVINEQYFLVPLGLLITWWAIHAPANPRVRRLIQAIGIGTLFAAMIDGFHLFAFIRPEVASMVFGMTGRELANSLLQPFGIGEWQMLIWTRTIAAVILLPIGYYWIRLVARPINHGVAARVSRTGSRYFVPLLLVTLLIGVGGAAQPEAPVANSNLSSNPVLMVVRTDYTNPTSDPQTQAGSWLGYDALPGANGYYTMNAGKAWHDALRLKEIGVDAVLLIYTPAESRNAVAWQMALAEIGIPFKLVQLEGSGQLVLPTHPLWHKALFPPQSIPEAYLPARAESLWYDAEAGQIHTNVEGAASLNSQFLELNSDARPIKANKPLLIHWNDLARPATAEYNLNILSFLELLDEAENPSPDIAVAGSAKKTETKPQDQAETPAVPTT